MEEVKEMARVRDYETTFVIAPDVEEETRENIIERIKNIIDDYDGETNEDEINDYKTGYYTMIDFTAETPVIDELERQFSIITNVLRHLIVKKED